MLNVTLRPFKRTVTQRNQNLEFLMANHFLADVLICYRNLRFVLLHKSSGCLTNHFVLLPLLNAAANTKLPAPTTCFMHPALGDSKNHGKTAMIPEYKYCFVPAWPFLLIQPSAYSQTTQVRPKIHPLLTI